MGSMAILKVPIGVPLPTTFHPRSMNLLQQSYYGRRVLVIVGGDAVADTG